MLHFDPNLDWKVYETNSVWLCMWILANISWKQLDFKEFSSYDPDHLAHCFQVRAVYLGGPGNRIDIEQAKGKVLYARIREEKMTFVERGGKNRKVANSTIKCG